MKVVFIGVGYVGLITSLVLASKNKKDEFWCIDNNQEKIEMLKSGVPHFFEPGLDKLLRKVKNINFISNYNEQIINNADIIFICVGTPISENGNWDLNYIYNSIDNIFKFNTSADIIVKSTVPIGFCSELQNYIKEKYSSTNNIINNPEFLSQGSAVNDTINPNRIIIGVNNNESKKNISKLYKKFKNVLYMSREASEMSKIAANNFLATKLSFFNEISNICRLKDIKVSDVINSMKYDDRIGNKYMTPGVGYGGSCLPKDTKSLSAWTKSNGYDSKLINATIEVNEKQKTIIIDLLEKHSTKEIKTVSILGLTFKSKTDDIRDSSSIECIKLLLKKKMNIKVFDPKGMNNTNKVFGEKIIYANSIEECISKSDAVLIMNDWEEFKLMNSLDIDNIMNKNYLIIDSSNIINDNIKHIKLNY